MRILAIETLPNDTAVHVLAASDAVGERDAGSRTIGRALMSELPNHVSLGDIFPDVAKQEYTQNIVPLIKRALADAALYRESANSITGASARFHTPAKPLLSPEKHAEIQAVLNEDANLRKNLLDFLKIVKAPDIDAVTATATAGATIPQYCTDTARALSIAWEKPLI